MGLIHEVVPADELLARAKAWLMAPATEKVVPAYAGKGAKPIDGRAVQPWDRKGFKMPGFPGGQVWSPVGVQTFIGGNAMIAGKTNGVYPAPKAIMSCVYEGLQLPFDAALQRRDALLRLAAARSGRQEHDPHAVLRPAGSQQAGPPAQGRAEAGVHEDRRPGRRPDGRRHRHRLGAGRPRDRADRPRPGRGRQGQGAYRGRARQAGEARPPDPGQARRDAGRGHARRPTSPRSRAASW